EASSASGGGGACRRAQSAGGIPPIGPSAALSPRRGEHHRRDPGSRGTGHDRHGGLRPMSADIRIRGGGRGLRLPSRGPFRKLLRFDAIDARGYSPAPSPKGGLLLSLSRSLSALRP